MAKVKDRFGTRAVIQNIADQMDCISESYRRYSFAASNQIGSVAFNRTAVSLAVNIAIMNRAR